MFKLLQVQIIILIIFLVLSKDSMTSSNLEIKTEDQGPKGIID